MHIYIKSHKQHLRTGFHPYRFPPDGLNHTLSHTSWPQRLTSCWGRKKPHTRVSPHTTHQRWRRLCGWGMKVKWVTHRFWQEVGELVNVIYEMCKFALLLLQQLSGSALENAAGLATVCFSVLSEASCTIYIISHCIRRTGRAVS